MISLSGPLGLWKFPLLGILFGMLSGGSRRSTDTDSPGAPERFTQNEERLEMVRGKKGELTGIVVHRKLE